MSKAFSVFLSCSRCVISSTLKFNVLFMLIVRVKKRWLTGGWLLRVRGGFRNFRLRDGDEDF